jgi:hypothetical protein
LLLAAVACLTQKDLWDVACATGCKKDGHDGGHAAIVNKKAMCVCERIYEFEYTTGKRLRIPSYSRQPSGDNAVDMNFNPSRWQEPKDN